MERHGCGLVSDRLLPQLSDSKIMDALNAEIGRLRLEVHNLKGESGAQNISIGNYLLVRLEQLGVKVLDMN